MYIRLESRGGFVPKTDRRIPKTRQAIQNALIELMAEKAFDRITINDIAQKADLNRGTLYLHYADKYDLLDQCIKDHLSQMVAHCMLSNPDEPCSDIVQSPLPLFRHLEKHFVFYASMLNNKGLVCFKEQLVAMVKNGIAERLKKEVLREASNQEAAVQYMTSAFVGVVEWWIQTNMPLTPTEMAKQLKDMVELNFSLHFNRAGAAAMHAIARDSGPV
ncbi:TetR/AcrR family transcriptional regulator C-terminal domain-containing protein [Paenibacillus sp. MWE-103]|uniref:TetR/AcrR family transcriptional regulator C-terminal domain-containing protein n=1 Tax=Paenibacillus artemisiicola TaxID=1172618 RepID=A0ABS3W5D8_9BACL|nr:TetR/AcrR family transcriptional regulator [Paenibacillus artemisiicola]MBO7743508.1 TetR/AcrR family transcriptional regulator C-terminal domain-containing protein [Paenibacillus artemisiicola]